MKRRTALATATAVALTLFGWNADAQTAQSVAGTYSVVKINSYGPGARGMMILTPDGHYSINLARATLPKFVANSRVNGTAEENKAIVEGSIFHYGNYTVDDGGKFITFNIKASAFPNFDGTTQKRVLKVNGDELVYLPVTASGGGAPQDVVWRRMK